MTERDFYKNVVRPALHRPPDHLLVKVQDAFVKGLPDCAGILGGQAYWAELKRLPHRPVRQGTPYRLGVTMEQRAWLRRWEKAGGVSLVLVGFAREHEWAIFDIDTPDEFPKEAYELYAAANGTWEDKEKLFSSIAKVLYDHVFVSRD